MITILTICSANYLAQAKTLGDSLIRHNPHYNFVIGLVDRLEQRLDSSYWEPHELIEVEDIEIPNFQRMCKKYNIVELNTAVKPFYMEYLYNRDPQTQAVIYIDPDILVFNKFKELENKLDLYNIILTPHSCTVGNDKINKTYEIAMLRTGLYNLGFIATSRSEETLKFLHWWQERLKEYCFYKPGTGLFVDQIWANLVPFYFEKVYVEKYPGYNVCYWNLFERKISIRDDTYWVNEDYPLIFYHFSNYKPSKPELICTRAGYNPLDKRPDLVPLFDEYRTKLLSNAYEDIIKLECYFNNLYNQQPSQKRILAQKILKNIYSGLPSRFKVLVKEFNKLIEETI